MPFPHEDRRIQAGLAAALLLAVAGCSAAAASRKPKIASARPPSAAVLTARAELTAGWEAALSGDFQCAEEAYARALDAVRPARGEPPTDTDTIAVSLELYDAMLRTEALAPAADTDTREAQEASRVPA